MLQFFKSILDQDKAPVVVCDMHATVIYMNPAAIKRYHCDLTGKNLKNCHTPAANEKIDRVLEGFLKVVKITLFTLSETIKRIRMFIWLHFVTKKAHS